MNAKKIAMSAMIALFLAPQISPGEMNLTGGEAPSATVGDTKSKSAEDHPLQFVLELRDGSQIVGLPRAKEFSLRTSYANLQIPFSRVDTVTYSDEPSSVLVELQNGDKLQGTVNAASITLKTAFGEISIPSQQILRISMRVDDEKPWGMVFDGGDSIKIPGSTSLYSNKLGKHIDTLPQPVRSCTWTFWIRTTQNTGADIISKDISGGGVHDFYLCVNDGFPPAPNKLSWVEGTNGADFKWRTVQDINDGIWHQVALVRDFEAGTVQFFVDGRAEAAGGNPRMWEIENDRPLSIGASLRGELRDVRFYPNALTRGAILKLSKGQLPDMDCYIVPLGKRTSLPTLSNETKSEQAR